MTKPEPGVELPLIKREPGLELLLRGELIALSPLAYHNARVRMLDALRAWVTKQRDARAAYTQRDPSDPGVAIIEALAACLEVMGFYHDRILTESKLGAALRLADVTRLGEFVGYRPSPPLAASARQFFEAVATGDLPEGTRVAGRGGALPTNVVFRTRSAIRVGPAFNRMALSPLVTRQANAVRALLSPLDAERAARSSLDAFARLAEQQSALPPALPSDDFRTGLLALLNGPRGLELCPVAGNRRGGVAFQRPLLRSYDEQATTVSRATRVRRLRFGQPLGDHDELVVFEASREPILHLPEPGAPLLPESSTLELFVFDDLANPDDVPPPNTWDRKTAWREVPDFSASEASDRHYRTFLDDRLVTYIVLRRQLGHRTLLDERALERVYIRYTPAIGRVIEHPTDPPAAVNLERVTMRLVPEYFTTALVRPTVELVDPKSPETSETLAIENEAGWAVTEVDLSLAAGEQIAVLGGSSGRVFVRTLTSKTSGRYLHWFGATNNAAGRPAQEHNAIEDVFDLTKAKIAPLEDVARGQSYPLWQDYYKQARDPSTTWGKPTDETKIPPDVYAGADPNAIVQRVVLHRGSTFLLLGTSSYVKSGDYLLIGRRLKASYRKVAAKNDDGSSSPGFDEHAPWLTAEVVQALEVQGNLVRLRDPISQDFYEDRTPDQGGDAVTEVVIVPRVASVYYGDRFAQRKVLTNERTFTVRSSELASKYFRVPFEPADDAFVRRDLRAALGLEPFDPPSTHDKYDEEFKKLFLAVSNETVSTQSLQPQWVFHVDVPKRGLEASQVAGLWLRSNSPPGGTLLTLPTGPEIADVEGTDLFRIQFASAVGASLAAGAPGDLLLDLQAGEHSPQWGKRVEVVGPLQEGEFRLESEAAWYFQPLSAAGAGGLAASFFANRSGVLLIEKSPRPHDLLRWDAQNILPRGLRLKEGASQGSNAIDVTAIRSGPTLSTSDVATWFADWELKAEFENKTDWVEAGIRGTMATEAPQQALPFAYNAIAKRFELHKIAIKPGTPLEPLHGAAQLWTLPPGGELALSRKEITAEWAFSLGPSADGVLADGQRVLVVLASSNVALRSARVEKRSGAKTRLNAEVSGDSRTLDPQPIHVLHEGAADGVARREIVHLVGSIMKPSGSGLSGASRHRRTAALTTDGSTKAWRATIWWEDDPSKNVGTLRLIPELGALPPPTSPGDTDLTIDRFIEFHDKTPISIIGASYSPITNRTQFRFTLPSDWPEGELPIETVVVGDQIINAAPPLKSAKGQRVIEFEGDQTSWTTIYLAYRNWPNLAQRRLHRVSALHAPNASWKPPSDARGLGVFFAKLDPSPDLVTIPPGSKFIAVAAYFDESNIELLAPATASDRFPSTPAEVYLSLLSAEPEATSGLDIVEGPVGKVRLRVGVPPETAPDKIGFLSVFDGTVWADHALTADSITMPAVGVWTVRLDKAVSEVFPEPLPDEVTLRLAYDIATSLAASVGLALRATILPEKLQQAGVDDPACGANAALLYRDEHVDDSTDDLAGGLITSFVPGQTGWVFDPIVGPKDVFRENGALRFDTIGFGQRFKGLPPKSIALAPLTLSLGRTSNGKSLKLEKNDVLGLTGTDDASSYAEVTKAEPGADRYELKLPTPRIEAPIKAVSLRVMRVTDDNAVFGGRFGFNRPAAPPPLWMLSFAKPGASILGSLLRYTEKPVEKDGRVEFSFDHQTVKALLLAPITPVSFYTNQSGQLRRDLYVRNVARAGVDPDNFLKSDAAALLVADGSKLSQPTSGEVRVLLASIAKLPPADQEKTLERRLGKEPQEKSLEFSVYSESIVFNSGNFIPVTGMLADSDGKVVRNALRVELRVDEAAAPAVMTYDSALATIVEKLETDPSSFEYVGPQRLYSFNKVPGGAFTLNFLVIDMSLPEVSETWKGPLVTVHVEYGADVRPPAGDGDSAPLPRHLAATSSDETCTGPAAVDALYAFETWLKELDPSTQLVALDSGPLKPDDYLFLHTAADPGGVEPPVQWARITSVIGPVVQVSPVSFDLANFRRYALRGFSKPPRPAGLDKGYYALLAGATFRLPAPMPPLDTLPASVLTLPLGDRLVLDRVGDQTLLAALVPGDRLLVWDERYREAWRLYRVESVSLASGGATWFDWPDYQHEAVVKEVDAATGLVVLTEPLPERFAVRFALANEPPKLTLAPDSPSLRVLPHYRAPFQGERAMTVLGSGDKSRRFARYTGVLPTSPGLASVPLAKPDMYASNVEVLTRDARSGEWARWVEFADIERAKKDPAFVLGLDAQALEANGEVPFSVSFGDGKDHGLLLPTGVRNVFARTTALGPWREHADRRPQRLVIFSTTHFCVQDDLPFCVPPEATVAAKNLKLVIEASEPEQWGPGGQIRWRKALSFETKENGAVTTWREITAEEASQGYDGVWVRGLRPGVVEAFFFARRSMLDATVTAWALPEGRVWALNDELYQKLAEQDPTRGPGTTMLQVLETEGIVPGSLLAFSRDGRETPSPELVSVSTVDPDTWIVSLAKPLEHTYSLSQSSLCGNLAEVVEGDVKRSFLGSGDGSTRNLRLPLYNRERLLYTTAGEGTDPEPDVRVLVDGLAWERVIDLAGAGPRDRVYRLDIDADGVGASVVFGDGKQGAVPPPGVNNIEVEAAFASGEGGAGNLPRGAIDKLVDGNLAVKTTRNLVEATGGRPGDTANQARTKLLSRNVGFDRIVTLDDVARVAREEVGEVLHARVDPTAPKGTLLLAVALRDRRDPTEPVLESIRKGIAERMPATAGVELKVKGAVQVPVYVVVEFDAGAGQRQGDVLATLERAFAADRFFAADRWPLAEPLRLGDLYEAIFKVKGVSFARVVWMSEHQPPQDPSGPASERVDPGPRGVIRCDSDLVKDPNRERGSIRFRPRITKGGTP